MLTMAAALGGAAVGTGLLNAYLQYDQQQYNQQLQHDIFAREDTSIARRVADLKASGLSPVLAAGQGAGTGGTVSVNAPQLDLREQQAMNLLKMEQDISATRAQEYLTSIQAYAAGQMLPAQLSSIEAQIKKMDADTYKTYQEAKKAKVEADNMVKTGTSGQNPLSQIFRDITGSTTKVGDEIKKLQDKAKGKPVRKPFWQMNADDFDKATEGLIINK